MADWQVRIVNDITGLDPVQWDALVGGESPFLEWDWLASLEVTGCVGASLGWGPHHIVVERGPRLIAACPLYLKSNSEGEFIFDYEWAHAASNAGLNYYPKLLVAVPFTPANGIRFLTAEGENRRGMIQVMGQVLIQICDQNNLSSVHVNFCRDDEVEALGELGFLERLGVQYHWENHGYSDFEDFLSGFRSKRRTKIRRERREMKDQRIVIRALTGEEIEPALAPVMYRLYQEHVEKLYWGRRYLNEEFFRRVTERFSRNLCFVVAEKDGEIIAGTFNVQKGGGLLREVLGDLPRGAPSPFQRMLLRRHRTLHHPWPAPDGTRRRRRLQAAARFRSPPDPLHALPGTPRSARGGGRFSRP